MSTQTNITDETKWADAADKLLWDQMATLPLFQKPTLLAFSNSYTGIADNATNAGPLWNSETFAPPGGGAPPVPPPPARGGAHHAGPRALLFQGTGMCGKPVDAYARNVRHVTAHAHEVCGSAHRTTRMDEVLQC